MKQVLRRLLGAPLFTILSLTTLAIGIGANTAVFSVLNGILLKPLPYPDPDRLVAIWETFRKDPQEHPSSPSAYFTYREEGRVYQDVALWHLGFDNMTGAGEPEQVDALYVTDGFLPLVGVHPILGRSFSRLDDSPGSPQTIILMNAYWRRKFAADPSVIGRRIMVDGESTEVIGVMPPRFRFMDTHVDVMTPPQFNRAKTFVGAFGYQAVARLKPGETLASASADVARMLPMMIDKFPPAPGMTSQMYRDFNFGPSVRLLKSDLVGNTAKLLWVLMATLGAVLLIACANITNLMLVRAEGRQQELAIRSALGAGWWGIAKGLLLESVVLGVAGGALGVAVAYAALRALVLINPGNLPRLDEIAIDRTVLLFSLSISLLSGVLSGLIPVFKYTGPRLAGVLRQGGRSTSEGRERHRARNVLVVVQVALAVVLLIGSGLMLRTASALKQVPPGFTQPGRILTMQISIPDAELPKREALVPAFYEILDRIKTIPGVESVCISNSMTMDGSIVMGHGGFVFVAGRTYVGGETPPLRRFKYVSPGYFNTMGNPLLAGRDLTRADIQEARPVVVISEALARELWHEPAAAAVGKRIQEVPNAPWREIVGVAGNEHDDGPDHKASAIAYWPMPVRHFFQQELLIARDQVFGICSVQADSKKLLNDVRQAVWSVNRNIPLARVRTMQEIYDKSMARPSFALVMLTIAAGMALLLGVVGIYGVVSYAVSQRTREIGIRMALGAPPQSVCLLFVRECLLLIVVGLVCGVAGAAALSRLMTTLLFEVSPLDPATYLTVSALLAATALLASYIPARRAARIEPMEALRAE
jgi:putative ABC transport system permease protein